VAVLLIILAQATGLTRAQTDDPGASRAAARAAEHGQHQPQEAAPSHAHGLSLDGAGAVMNENAGTLPRDCAEISREHEITVYAGREFAAEFPGNTFGFSQYEYRVEPCSRVTVTLVNNDDVRHQWMVHGLPRYLYPTGMFHIEAAGGDSRTGTFVVPSDHRTYLVHCDMPQHMERGMKAQLKVGRGSGDLWSIPGISGDFERDSYLPRGITLWFLLAVLSGAAIFSLLTYRRGGLTVPGTARRDGVGSDREA
jgi:plastocyanin